MTAAVVRAAHDYVIENSGGLSGEYENLLEGALGAVWQAYSYEQIQDEIHLATWTAHALTVSHSFTDGNKRTALLVMDMLLYGMGVEVCLPAEDTADVIEAVADGKLDRDDLDRFVREQLDED